MSVNIDILKKTIKKEFKGWNIFEITAIVFICVILLFNRFYFKDNPVSICSAFCGILYTVIAGKGKISCYFFGLSGSFLYGYLAFVNGLYGNLLLYLLYYIPMQIIGIFKWRKNLKISTNEIYKTQVKNKKNIILSATLLCIFTCIVLKLINDSSPFYDGITTAFSIIGMYLTVKRCIEQWVIWGIVNAISAIMWIKIALEGENVYSTVFMWITYLLLSFYFYYKWNIELQEEKKAG